MCCRDEPTPTGRLAFVGDLGGKARETALRSFGYRRSQHHMTALQAEHRRTVRLTAALAELKDHAHRLREDLLLRAEAA